MAAVNSSVTALRARGGERTAHRGPRRGVRISVRLGAGIVIVIATVRVWGPEPFLHGIAAISPLSLLAALGLTALATTAAAWRWQVVADGYDLHLSWRDAFAGYYRSQFLNSVLPAGVLGDVHRAWRHGRSQDRFGAAARAVAVERVLGQAVQLVLTLSILPLLGFASPLLPLLWCAGAVAALLAIAATHPRTRTALRRECRSLRPVLARRATLPAIVAASIVVVVSHLALFLVAAVAVGAPLGGGLVAAALIVLAAAAIPLNIGGWGPREATAAAAFALAGLGGSAGIAASTAFGTLALIAVAPGAVLLVTEGRRTT